MVDVDEDVVKGVEPAEGGGAPGRVGARHQRGEGGQREDEEGERDAEAHGRRLAHRPAAAPLRQRAAGGAPQRHAHQRVAHRDDGERHHADERQGEPRAHVQLEVAVAGQRAAVREQAAAVPHRPHRPEEVRVLGNGGDQQGGAAHGGGPGGPPAPQRQAHGDEPVDGEGNKQPDGHVTRRVEREETDSADGRRQLDHRAGRRVGEPMHQTAEQQHDQVARRQARQVGVGRGAAQAGPRQDGQRERVAEHPDDEDGREAI